MCSIEILILLGTSLNFKHWGVSPMLRPAVCRERMLILTAPFRFLTAWIRCRMRSSCKTQYAPAGLVGGRLGYPLISSYWLEKQTRIC